jgi:hypothetical protein
MEEEIGRHFSAGNYALEPDSVRTNIERWRAYQPDRRKIRLFVLSGPVPGMSQNEWDVRQMSYLLENPRLSAALAAGWVQKLAEAMDKGNGKLCCCLYEWRLITCIMHYKVNGAMEYAEETADAVL